MNNDNRGFTIEALVVRLIVLAFAAVAIPRTSEKIQKTSGAFSTGLRAIQYRWLDWTIPIYLGPRTPDSAEVPIFCPEDISDQREFYSWTQRTPKTPSPFFVITSGELRFNRGAAGDEFDYKYLALQSEDLEDNEHLCTYPLPDSSWLIVTTRGRSMHLDASFRRLDEPPALRRVATHFGEHPVAGTWALVVLATGAWLVFRRRQVGRLTFVGLALAAYWLVPLASFLRDLPMTP